jgi:hypothetical protein
MPPDIPYLVVKSEEVVAKILGDMGWTAIEVIRWINPHEYEEEKTVKFLHPHGLEYSQQTSSVEHSRQKFADGRPQVLVGRKGEIFLKPKQLEVCHRLLNPTSKLMETKIV